MANFRYSACDAQGRLQSGEIDAPSETAVADQLQRRQLIPLKISEIASARQLQLETPSALSVCALVRQGLGVAIVNPLTALEMAASQALQVRPFSVSIPFHLGKVVPQWRPAHPLRSEFEQALGTAVEAQRGQLARLG